MVFGTIAKVTWSTVSLVLYLPIQSVLLLYSLVSYPFTWRKRTEPLGERHPHTTDDSSSDDDSDTNADSDTYSDQDNGGNPQVENYEDSDTLADVGPMEILSFTSENNPGLDISDSEDNMADLSVKEDPDSDADMYFDSNFNSHVETDSELEARANSNFDSESDFELDARNQENSNSENDLIPYPGDIPDSDVANDSDHTEDDSNAAFKNPWKIHKFTPVESRTYSDASETLSRLESINKRLKFDFITPIKDDNEYNKSPGLKIPDSIHYPSPATTTDKNVREKNVHTVDNNPTPVTTPAKNVRTVDENPAPVTNPAKNVRTVDDNPAPVANPAKSITYIKSYSSRKSSSSTSGQESSTFKQEVLDIRNDPDAYPSLLSNIERDVMSYRPSSLDLANENKSNSSEVPSLQKSSFSRSGSILQEVTATVTQLESINKKLKDGFGSLNEARSVVTDIVQIHSSTMQKCHLPVPQQQSRFSKILDEVSSKLKHLETTSSRLKNDFGAMREKNREHVRSVYDGRYSSGGYLYRERVITDNHGNYNSCTKVEKEGENVHNTSTSFQRTSLSSPTSPTPNYLRKQPETDSVACEEIISSTPQNSKYHFSPRRKSEAAYQNVKIHQSPKKITHISALMTSETSPQKACNSSPRRMTSETSPQKACNSSPRQMTSETSPQRACRSSPRRMTSETSPQRACNSSPRRMASGTSPQRACNSSPRRMTSETSPQRACNSSPRRMTSETSPQKTCNLSPRRRFVAPSNEQNSSPSHKPTKSSPALIFEHLLPRTVYSPPQQTSESEPLDKIGSSLKWTSDPSSRHLVNTPANKTTETLHVKGLGTSPERTYETLPQRRVHSSPRRTFDSLHLKTFDEPSQRTSEFQPQECVRNSPEKKYSCPSRPSLLEHQYHKEFECTPTRTTDFQRHFDCSKHHHLKEDIKDDVDNMDDMLEKVASQVRQLESESNRLKKDFNKLKVENGDLTNAMEHEGYDRKNSEDNCGNCGQTNCSMSDVVRRVKSEEDIMNLEIDETETVIRKVFVDVVILVKQYLDKSSQPSEQSAKISLSSSLKRHTNYLEGQL